MFGDLSRGQIRLLHIQPGNGDQIVSDLEVVTLTSSVYKYDAVSYTWGGTDLTHEIIIGEEPYSVTSNLYTVLKHLRHEAGQKRTFWIDAICINQQDHDERTRQVDMMADIYRNARQVVIWLGEETVFDGISVEGIAFALLQQFKDVFEEHGLVDLDFQQTGPEGFPCPGYGLPNTNSKKWIALARLFSKPYFERIWVIQEVVMATKAIVVCGTLKIEWEVVRNFARSLQKGGSLGNLEYEGAAPGVISVNVMADLKEGSGIDLLPLLVKTRAYQATKKVDKAFALMNLSLNSQDVGINVDYSLENEPIKVWEKLALHSLTVHKSLLCLSNAGICSSSQQSWVPNWSDRDEGRACLALYGKEHFRASRDTKASVSVSEDLQILTVDGYIVDSIAAVAPNVPEFVPKAMKSGPPDIWVTEEEDEERRTKILAEIQNPLQIAKSTIQYTEGLSRDRELARTLCCDILVTGEKADIDSAYKVHQWMIRMFDVYAWKLPPGNLEEVNPLVREVESTKPPGVKMEQFCHSATLFGSGRSVCATAGGDLGRVPFGTRPGDLVCIFKGGIVPYILRAEGVCYKLVGECYMNGIMYGQALDRRDIVYQVFKII